MNATDIDPNDWQCVAITYLALWEYNELRGHTAATSFDPGHQGRTVKDFVSRDARRCELMKKAYDAFAEALPTVGRHTIRLKPLPLTK